MKKITNKTLNEKLDRIIALLQPEISGSPVPSEGGIRVIEDDGKLKTSEILNECRKLFKVWSFYSDEQLDKDFPPPKNPTSRKFKNVQEADEDLKDKSANDLKKEGIEGITLRERLLFELAYFKETGKHLDINNLTLCSGSRYSVGNVPCVGWSDFDGKLSVDYADPSFADGLLRSRQVVS